MQNLSSDEIRLRLVEALARNQSAKAVTDTKGFIKVVAEIETFVLGSQPTEAESDTPSRT